MITAEKAIEIGVEKGIAIAMTKWQEQENKKTEKKYDRRLHNTKLLLSSYKSFKTHCENTTFTASSLIDKELLDMIDENKYKDGHEVFIQSIFRTKERTAIMLNYITQAIEFYEYSANESKEEDRIRRAKVIRGLYMDSKKIRELADELYVSTKTIGRDRDQAIAELTPLIFGIDGIRLK